MLYNMREIRAIRKTAKGVGNAAGALALPVMAIALVPHFLALVALAVAIALVIIAVGMVRDHYAPRPARPAPRLILDEPAREYRRRMAELGVHIR